MAANSFWGCFFLFGEDPVLAYLVSGYFENGVLLGVRS